MAKVITMTVPEELLNGLQIASIERLFNTTRGMHHADVTIRRDGQDHHFEADWLKHVVLRRTEG